MENVLTNWAISKLKPGWWERFPIIWNLWKTTSTLLLTLRTSLYWNLARDFFVLSWPFYEAMGFCVCQGSFVENSLKSLEPKENKTKYMWVKICQESPEGIRTFCYPERMLLTILHTKFGTKVFSFLIIIAKISLFIFMSLKYRNNFNWYTGGQYVTRRVV